MPRIASVDAVKHGVIECTISLESRGTPLAGQYVTIPSGDDLILGRMGEVDTTNTVHEDPAFKPILMKRGRIVNWSGDVDVETATVEMLAIINDKNQKIARRTNPSSGTDIMLASVEEIQRFYNETQYFLSIGTIPDAGDRLATITNRDFGPYEQGGYGEAMHVAIYGQNGSGKSVFAMMLVAGMLSAHPAMGLLMPDTAGDLHDPTKHDRGDFHWNYQQVLRSAGVIPEIVDIRNIRLTSPRTFQELLIPILRTSVLNMASEQASRLSELICYEMFDRLVDPSDITSDTVLTHVVNKIADVYATKATKDQKHVEAVKLQTMSGHRRRFDEALARLRQFFDGRHTLGDLIDGVLTGGRKVIIPMRTSSYLSEREKSYVMRELFSGLARRAEILFGGDQRANALVVLDEGQRWVPEGRSDTDEIGPLITQAYRETRKYGLGWMVISQRMTGVSKDVLAEARTVYFGKGLGIGADADHIKARLGEQGLRAYKELELQGGYPWVGIGMQANLGTEGAYFAVRPFDGDATAAFVRANPHIYRRGLAQ